MMKLFIFSIILIILLGLVVNHQMTQDMIPYCEKNKPIGFTIIFVGANDCQYESEEGKPYNYCMDYYKNTVNHGRVIDHFENSSCYIYR